MKNPVSAVSLGDEDHLIRLIDTLHDTVRQIEELTGGEVDSVADSQGRTFLLSRAQEQLRHSEEAKQAAILNALPAHIALLDSQGTILSVNSAWGDFASANLLAWTESGVGRNYLRTCDNATGKDSSEAGAAAAGIRAVLAREMENFTLEYPCHSPDQQRWFLMTVTPLSRELQNGVVVMHLDITQRIHSEEKLRRASAVMDTTADAIYMVDRIGMNFFYVNDAACRIHQETREEIISLGPANLLGKTRAELAASYDALIFSGMEAKPEEISRRRQDGPDEWFELRRRAQWSDDRWTIVSFVRDITERKRAEDSIKRLNRFYAVLGQINSLIVRVKDRAELFDQACKIAVEEGGFRMALISLVDNETGQIRPMASAGKSEKLLTSIRTVLASPDCEESMTARAIETRSAIVANDSRNDPQLLLGSAYYEAGVRSVAVFPLMVSLEAVGVLALYADEVDFFHAAEKKLLTELTDDISFALDYLAKQERLHYLAYYDALTGLANRALFLDRVEQHMLSAARGGVRLGVGVVDIERFKNINDSLGPAAGNVLLKQVADWLVSNLGGADFLARIDADHFAVVLPEIREDGSFRRLIEQKMTEFMEHSFNLNGAAFRISYKTGIAIFPDDGGSAQTLFNNAEAALKKAKAGGERYLFFTEGMTATVSARLKLENQLRQAIEKNEFVLHYQPKINLATGLLSGAEALIRWNDPLTGLVPPGMFIPVLEETGLIYEVGRWALRQAVDDYLRWRAAGLPAVRISVNVSPLQLRNRNFIGEIQDAVATDACAAEGLELEITESVIMADVENSATALRAIRAMGVSVAIDDFGTGFSSLSYLAKLPVDTLKIDRTFVIDMNAKPEGLAIVATIIDLAHSLNLKVVAEGVETEEQAQLLRILKCEEMQGFLFSKPVPREVFETRFLMSAAGV